MYRGGNIYLPDQKALFVHIPKTAGCWVHTVIDALKIPHRRARARDGYCPHFPAYACADEFDVAFSFVRHPVEWYRSWWKYQVGRWRRFTPHLWHPQKPLYDIQHLDFNRWVDAVVAEEPGYVSRMYEWFLGPPGSPWPKIHVGRQEHVEADLTAMFRTVGVDCPDIKDLGVARTNVSRGPEPEVEASTELSIRSSERVAIKRFY